MGKIKQELGPEAIILQTRQFREGGFFGLFGKTKVEITAAIDYEITEQKKYYINTQTQNPPPQNPLPQNVTVQKELENVHLMLEKMSQQIQAIEPVKSTWPAPLQKWAKTLSGYGINEKMIKKLLNQIQKNLNGKELADDLLVRKNLEESVQQLCSRVGAIQPGVKKPKVVALIGSTGVGKTTTIGKLAAGFSIVDKRRIALVTTDTYRVSAVDQLKTFGQIIGVPVEVAMSPLDLSEILSRHQDKELIFIDTAGRSPQHQLHMHELKAYMDAVKPDFTMLVLNMITQFNDQKRLINEFKPLATHLILTKMDETVCSGAMLNLLDYTSLPVAYITNGQNVPNDIEVATAKRLTKYILREV